MTQHSRRGFSLVELSIVLVVIALLTGGILAGKNMMRAAELRSVVRDAQIYQNALATFRTQYKYLPGDMPNATAYWGQSTTCAGAATTEESTCDGNADGIIAQGTPESFRAWQQLRNAEMIEPKLTGVAGSGGAADSIPGVNVPSSRIATAGFSLYYFSTTGSTGIMAATYGNMFTFGGQVSSMETTRGILNPGDAYSIDSKADDGKPATGKWIANGSSGGGWATAGACTTSANATDYAGNYNLSNTDTICSFFLPTGL